MFYAISMLSEEDIKKIKAEVEKLEFRDGKESARGKAKDVKNNQQITEVNKAAAPMFRGIKQLLHTNEAVKALAFPRSVSNIMINKYSIGETYGWHVDAATMNANRTDLSFTIFLNDPETYEGGELEIKDGWGRITKFKLPAGKMVLYSTGLLHQVTPITKGERLCIVGWIESFIKDDWDRNYLFEMQKLYSDLRKNTGAPSQEQELKLNELQNQIIRRLSS